MIFKIKPCPFVDITIFLPVFILEELIFSIFIVFIVLVVLQEMIVYTMPDQLRTLEWHVFPHIKSHKLEFLPIDTSAFTYCFRPILDIRHSYFTLITNFDSFVLNIINQVFTKFQDIIENPVLFVFDNLPLHNHLVIIIKYHNKIPNSVPLKLLWPINYAFKSICCDIPAGFIKINLTWKFSPIIVFEELSDIVKRHV